jgi:hypothetical protein
MELSISPFLVIDDNPHKDCFIIKILNLSCLSKLLDHEKDLDIHHKLDFGRISSPYICAKSLDLEGFAHMHG